MKTFVSNISSKGQIVIPAELRAEMALQPGTRVVFEREGDTIVMRPVTWESIAKLRGMFKGSNLEQIRDREHRKERF